VAGIDDCFVDLLALQMKRLAGDAGPFGCRDDGA